MPSRNPTDDREFRIPIGLVLAAIGLTIMATAAAIWLLLPGNGGRFALPPLLQAAVVPTITPLIDPTGLIFLPESPVLSAGTNAGLPSEATVAEAPRQLPATRAHQPVRLAIPALGVSANIREVSLVPFDNGGQIFYQWSVPSSTEAGWHNTSALLGETGNTVINGHNNVHGAIFRDLINLVEGDELLVYDMEQAHRYRVRQVELLPEQGEPVAVRLANARWIEPSQDERLTLVSCWPYETNSHRVVVIAVPIGNLPS